MYKHIQGDNVMVFDLFKLIRNEANILTILFFIFSYAVLIFGTLPIHEFAHAFVADKLGDPTPRWNRRLSLNPMNHLDPIGTLMILLFNFGYAKPVPVNPANFSKPKKHMALTALAGPVSNILMAVIACALYKFILFINGNNYTFTDSGDITVSSYVIIYAEIILIDVIANINLSLAVFNLLPIFPLDGSRIFAPIIPDKIMWKLEENQRVVTIVLFALLFTGALTIPLGYLRSGLGWCICTPMGLPNYF